MRILGVDPGTAKTGLAIVDGGALGSLRLMSRCIVPTGEIVEALVQHISAWQPDEIAVGDGTQSARLVRLLTGLALGKPVVVVDEVDSSREGRRRYLLDHRPRGLGKLIPLGMRTPPRATDDYAAAVLAERRLAAIVSQAPGTLT